jgi:hypothetical protein
VDEKEEEGRKEKGENDIREMMEGETLKTMFSCLYKETY